MHEARVFLVEVSLEVHSRMISPIHHIEVRPVGDHRLLERITVNLSQPEPAFKAAVSELTIQTWEHVNAFQPSSRTASCKTFAGAISKTAFGNAGVGFLVETNAQMTIKNGTATDNNIGVQSSGVVVPFGSTVAHNINDGLKIITPGTIVTGGNNCLFDNSSDGKAVAKLLNK